jgi:hypothetical protein
MQPMTLAGSLAGLAAHGLRTVTLPSHVAGVRMKEALTVLTLALSDVMSHWPASPQANDCHVAAWKKEGREENTGERRGKKNEEIYSNGRFRKKKDGGTLHFHPVRLAAISGHR